MYGEKCTQHNRSAFAETDKTNEKYRTKRIFLITDGSGSYQSAGEGSQGRHFNFSTFIVGLGEL